MPTQLPTTALALALLALMGCGQTGPLQLPPPEEPAPAAAEDAPAAAPASNG